MSADIQAKVKNGSLPSADQIISFIKDKNSNTNDLICDIKIYYPNFKINLCDQRPKNTEIPSENCNIYSDDFIKTIAWTPKRFLDFVKHGVISGNMENISLSVALCAKQAGIFVPVQEQKEQLSLQKNFDVFIDAQYDFVFFIQVYEKLTEFVKRGFPVTPMSVLRHIYYNLDQENYNNRNFLAEFAKLNWKPKYAEDAEKLICAYAHLIAQEEIVSENPNRFERDIELPGRRFAYCPENISTFCETKARIHYDMQKELQKYWDYSASASARPQKVNKVQKAKVKNINANEITKEMLTKLFGGNAVVLTK